jgi:beta-glucosidase
LFGDYNPGGRLPISLPVSVGQVPVYYNHKPSGGRSNWKGDYVGVSSRPLFPFGHGLSFTHFEFTNLQIDPRNVRSTDSVRIQFDVTNVGDRGGDEVVQLYLRDVVASVTRPVKELKGFERIELGAGERKSVQFEIAVDQLSFYDRNMRRRVEPGAIEVMVGASSEDIRLSGQFEIIA